jgi:dTDP-4-amino-4,6-dideoxygalactose transaminase
MLTVKNEKKAGLVAGLRHNGIRAFSGERPHYWVPAMSNVDTDIEGVWPTKLCLGEAQCALGSALLNRLDCVNEGLRRQREYLRGKLSECREISFQYEPSGHHAIFHCCVATFEGGELGKTREDFMSLMTKKHGIRLIVQYYPLYRYPLFKKMGFGEADCPNLESFWPNSFSYPWCLDIGEEKLDYMADRTLQSIVELKG